MSKPKLSVIVAAAPNHNGLTDCLTALNRQRNDDVEVLVVSPGEPPTGLTERFPWMGWIQAEPESLIPQRWGLGMAQAQGDIIAITTAHFTPAPDWLSAIRRAHARLAAPALGGPIQPPRGRGPLHWATFFLRYSSFLNYDRERIVLDVPGDNASYKRATLPDSEELRIVGFWERNVHRTLWKQGLGPVYVPDIYVRQHACFGFLPFLYQRFQHGRQFGRDRLSQHGPLTRALALVSSPLIPFVFWGKILGQVARSGRDFGPFFSALPALFCFLLSWSLGEISGYIWPARKDAAAVTRLGGVRT